MDSLEPKRNPFQPIQQPRQLSEEVADYVREAILSGRLPNGAPLSIDGLARDLSVSSTPVREALLALRGEGFVLLRPRRGYAATSVTLAELTDVYWMHGEIAAELARRATDRADASFIARLEGFQRTIEQALHAGALEQVESLNFALHREINIAAEAQKLRWMLRHLLRYVPRRFFGSVPGWAQASANDHTAIVDAMRRGDSIAAEGAMREHIRHAGALLADNLKQ